MTRRRAIAITLALALLLLALFLARKGPELEPVSNASSSAPAAAPKLQPQLTAASVSNPPGATPPERSPLADVLNSPTTDITADLRLVLRIIETFRSNFLQTGNPVGANADITSALTGRNRLRLSLIPADHPAINKEGELCDRWGTPFFFHAESATRMEVRSAGPDRKMWSDDDVVLSP